MVIIKYVSPIDQKVHRYYTDFAVKYTNKNNEIRRSIIEVKPEKQSHKPKISYTKSGKPTRRYMKEHYTWKVNEAKWAYAEQWCKANGYTFEVWNEKDIDKITGIYLHKHR